MAVVFSSWTKKLSRRRCRLLLPSSTTAAASSPKPPEVVLAANLGCTKCQKRVADAISTFDEVESIVVHVLEKKLIIISTQASNQAS